MPPNYAAYKATNALLGLKAAYEKGSEGRRSSPEPGTNHRRVRNLAFDGVGGTVRMALGKGHQASWTTPSARRSQGGQLTIVDVKRYAGKVNPPEE